MRTPEPHPVPERRQSVRLDVLDQLDGHVLFFNLPVKLRDISAGGIATESIVEIPVGARHLLRFTTPAGKQIVVAARVTHHRPAQFPDGTSRFVTGFAFLDETAGETIAALMDATLGDPQP